MFVCVTFIATLIRFVTTPLVYEIKNNGDRFYCRKSMRAADEKLIINELGPNSNVCNGDLCQVVYGRARWRDAFVAGRTRRRHELLSQAEVGCLAHD